MSLLSLLLQGYLPLLKQMNNSINSILDALLEFNDPKIIDSVTEIKSLITNIIN